MIFHANAVSDNVAKYCQSKTYHKIVSKKFEGTTEGVTTGMEIERDRMSHQPDLAHESYAG